MKKLLSLALAILLLAALVPAVPITLAAGAAEASTLEELKSALQSGVDTVYIIGDIQLTETLHLAAPVTLEGRPGSDGALPVLRVSGAFAHLYYAENAFPKTAPLVLRNLIFDGGDVGGGFERLSGDVVMDGCTIRFCRAEGLLNTTTRTYKGGMEQDYVLTLRSCLLENNAVPGFCLLAFNEASITDTVIRNNTAEVMLSCLGQAALENCRVENNTGPAMELASYTAYADWGVWPAAQVSLTDCAIMGNRAAEMAGILIHEEARLTLVHTLVADNGFGDAGPDEDVILLGPEGALAERTKISLTTNGQLSETSINGLGPDSRDFTIGLSPPPQFTDIQGHWGEPAVLYLAKYGYLQVGGLFLPQAAVTRGELLSLLNQAVGHAAEAETEPQPEPSDAPITRQEMFILLYHTLEAAEILPEMMTMEFIEFADWDDVAEEARAPLQTLAKLKLIRGTDARKLLPTSIATRAEAAQLVYNLLRWIA